MKHFNLKSPLIPLCLLILIDHIGYGILFPILVPLFMGSEGILVPETTEFARSIWYNVILTIFPITLFFGSTLLGGFSDQFGRKRILIFCLLAAILSYFLTGIAIDLKNIPLLMFSRVLAGLAAGSMPIAQAAIIDISEEKEKAANLSLVILAASVGFLLGPLIGGFFSNSNIVGWFGYSTPFYIASLLAFLNLCFLVFFFKETFVPRNAKPFNLAQCLEYYTAPFFMKNIRYLSLICLFIQLGWSLYFQFVSVFLLKRFEFNSQDISFFMTLMGIGFAIGSCFGLRFFSKFVNDVKLALLSLIVIDLCVLSVAIELHSVAIWVASLLLGITMSMVYSLTIKFFSEVVSEEQQGWIMGVTEAIIAVAWAATPLASAYLEKMSISLPLMVATILFIVSTFMLGGWKNTMKNERSI